MPYNFYFVENSPWISYLLSFNIAEIILNPFLFIFNCSNSIASSLIFSILCLYMYVTVSELKETHPIWISLDFNLFATIFIMNEALLNFPYRWIFVKISQICRLFDKISEGINSIFYACNTYINCCSIWNVLFFVKKINIHSEI